MAEKSWKKIKERMPGWIIRIFRYEFWPFWILYAPVIPYWIWLSLRARSFTFFTAANPGIEHGGFYGESKIEILKKIKTEFIPVTLFFPYGTSCSEVLQQIKKSGLTYPVIAKPDIGGRGYMVEKIKSERDMKNYFLRVKENFMVQEFIDYPIELGILYYRMPEGKESGILSFTKKEFMTIIGDGVSTIEELLQKGDYTKFRYKKIKKELGGRFIEVLPKNEKLLVEPIGNHARGTKFINGQDMINEQLVKVFDSISSDIDGFYYGRFDLRVSTYEDLYKGNNIKIVELNGVSSDAGHIYDENMTLLKVWRDMYYNLKIVYQISIQNHHKGVAYSSFRQFWKNVVQHSFKNG